MKNFFKGVGIFASCVVVIAVIAFVSGEGQAIYNKTVGKDVTNSENTKFHETQIYNDGMAQELSKDRKELQETTDTTARGAVVNDIRSRFANFNENNLQDQSLRQFLVDVRNGNIK